jgi:hypothetical protein
MGETNYGISGVGSLAAHNLAVGPRASIVEHATPAAAQQELDRLRAALMAYEGDAETRAQIATATEDVAQELAAPEPSKHKLIERLNTIKDAAGSASAVAAATTALISLVSQLF